MSGMNIFSSNLTELSFIFVAVLFVIWYFYYSYCFKYWERKGVPTIAPQFPAGNITKCVLGQENLFLTIAKYHKEFKDRGCKHGGLYFFNGPVYLPIDPEIIKSILTTDFEHFVDRGTFADEEHYPLSANLFSLSGSKWKNLRQKLSPAFSSGKLKSMYKIFLKTTKTFIETIKQRTDENNEVNIKYVSTNFTGDIIFSTAFGLEGQTLENPKNEIAKTALQILNPPNWAFAKTVLIEGFKNPGNLLRVVVDDKNPEYLFAGILKNAIKQRDENNFNRKDFLASLLEIRDKEGLSFNEILSQCFLFFLAGFETSSQTISFCIHELAHHQDFQNKLREEIFDKLGKNFQDFSYDGLSNLPYLDKVVNETIRKYPVLGFFNRICVKSYKIPGTDIVIEKGTPVLISALGLQRDPEYFPDPLKFDPDRFNDDASLVPFTFLPFGDGPRFCIGRRYGKLQTKLGIAALISRFKFYPSSKTPKNIEFDKFSKSLAMTPSEGITVKVQEL